MWYVVLGIIVLLSWLVYSEYKRLSNDQWTMDVNDLSTKDRVARLIRLITRLPIPLYGLMLGLAITLVMALIIRPSLKDMFILFIVSFSIFFLINTIITTFILKPIIREVKTFINTECSDGQIMFTMLT